MQILAPAVDIWRPVVDISTHRNSTQRADSTDSGVRFLMDFVGKHDFVLGLTRKYLDTVTSLSDKCGSIITRSAVWQVREMLHHWAASHSVTVSRWALPPSPPPEQSDPGIYIFLISSPYSSSSVLAFTWVCDPPSHPYFVWRRLVIFPSQNQNQLCPSSIVFAWLHLVSTGPYGTGPFWSSMPWAFQGTISHLHET